jgi:hypothetical protein
VVVVVQDNGEGGDEWARVQEGNEEDKVEKGDGKEGGKGLLAASHPVDGLLQLLEGDAAALSESATRNDRNRRRSERKRRTRR